MRLATQSFDLASPTSLQSTFSERLGLLLQSLAKPASPASAALKIFRCPANKLPCQRLTKSSQAPNNGAGDVPVNAGTCRGREGGDAEGHAANALL